jgi:holo-[acyl-carrier protein] synthase
MAPKVPIDTRSEQRQSYLRVGVDVHDVHDEDVARIAHGKGYVERLFTEEERDYVDSYPKVAQRFLAGRFAAREAVVKVLAIDDAAAPWTEIVIEGIRSARVSLSGAASAKATSLGIGEILLSVHYGRSSVIAVAVADARTEVTAEDSTRR